MFAKLREHSKTMDIAIKTLEADLETKLRPIFSVKQYEGSEASMNFVQDLIQELKALDDDVTQMVECAENLNEIIKEEYAADCEILGEMSKEIDKIETHLEDYGYERNTNISNGSDETSH